MTAIPVSEKQFQATVVQAARLLRWRVYHTYDSRRSDPGYPDLFLCHPQHGCLHRELKSDKGRVSTEQREWLDAINAAGGDAAVWRPSLWPLIEAELMGAA